MIADKFFTIAERMNRTISRDSMGNKPCSWDNRLNGLVIRMGQWFKHDIPELGGKLQEVVDAWNS